MPERPRSERVTQDRLAATGLLVGVLDAKITRVAALAVYYDHGQMTAWRAAAPPTRTTIWGSSSTRRASWTWRAGCTPAR